MSRGASPARAGVERPRPHVGRRRATFSRVWANLPSPVGLRGARRSVVALVVSVLAWAAGCATGPRPAIEPTFAARTYTPIRIALLPPDVFLVVDQVGDNDPARSEALRQKVFQELVQFSTEAFRQRGYDLNLSARWDGVRDAQGQILVGSDELGGMASAILQFANGPAGAQTGPLAVPQLIAPALAAKIGWATQSDSILYVNLKGVTTSNGKRTAEIIGAVFIVVVVALVVLALMAEGKGGGHSGSPASAVGPHSGSTVIAPAVRGVAPVGGGASMAGAGGGARGLVPVGRGSGFPMGGGPRRIYGGGPDIGIGIGVVIPLDGPVYTHSGSVEHEDEWFAGDQLYLSWTLVNAADGRVLWHLREDLDLDAEDPRDVRALVNRVVGSLPLRGDLTDARTPTRTSTPVSTPTSNQPPM
jgi:hypothetical protein